MREAEKRLSASSLETVRTSVDAIRLEVARRIVTGEVEPGTPLDESGLAGVRRLPDAGTRSPAATGLFGASAAETASPHGRHQTERQGAVGHV